MKRRKVCQLAVAAGCGFLALVLVTGWSGAQQPPGGPLRVRAIFRNAAQVGDEELGLDGVFLPPDRQAKRRLEVAGELIEEKRYGEAVRLLGSLLEGPEDFFFKPDPARPVYRSLKAESGRLLGELPREGRESYELQFGARARQMLNEAAAAGDVAQVAEVSRRFFHTQAGAEATFLLGRRYMDQNRPLAAAMCFERLQQVPQAAARLEPALSLSLAACWMRAGKPQAAEETLGAFRRRYDRAAIELKGDEVKLFAGEPQALAWMQKHFGEQSQVAVSEADQWVMFRGDESRNAPSSGGQPLLSLRWRQRTCDDAAIEEFVGKLRHDYLSQDMAALPSMHPLAVSDVVLMRTAFALQAVDFATGKLVWRYATGGESLEDFLRAMGSQQSGSATSQLLASVDRRMWEDLTYGTLSSDGAQVYSIEDLGLASEGSQVMTVLPNGQRRSTLGTRDTNRLAARELRTQGKLKWSVGGVTGEDEPKLAGTFFLGPPLPLMGYLYVLAEVKGQEIRLLALQPETGALEWSQQLAVVDPPIGFDESRRTSGATPSFADGVLVCPTAAGAVVGIDLSTRSLLWGYQYPRVHYSTGRRFNVGGRIYAGTDQRSTDHWADGSITIADSRVLITPTETDEIYCLNLADGKELWKQDRGTNLYVGCVHDDKLYLVGHSAITAVNLADGTKAGAIPLPEGSTPSGRGFHSGDHYYLPLSTAEVAKIDLAADKIVDRAQSRSGSIPGNLICYRDSIISQGPDYLDAYYQLDALRERIEQTLAARPNDPQALAALGEIKLDENDLAGAVELFRKSYALQADPTTRAQLVEALLEGMRTDFAAYRAGIDELDDLIQQPRHRTEFLRYKAIGLQRAGEVLPAFETYMQLVDDQAPWETDDIDDNLSVRRDRWIREQLAQLRAAADPQAERQIDAAVQARLEDALAADSAEVLRAFVGVFGSQPSAAAARGALVDKLGPDELLEQSLLLADQVLAEQDDVAGEAVARMALALHAAGQMDLAALYYRQLDRRFAEVVCLNQQTGRQLVAALAEDDPVRAHLAEGDWPAGRVTAKEEKTSLRGRRALRPQRQIGLEVVGSKGPLFDGLNLSITSDAQQYLVGDDGYGRNRFRVLVSDQGMRRVVGARSAYHIPSISYAGVHGGLAVLSMGAQLMAIDTLRPGDTLTNRVLWTEELNDQVGGLATMQSIAPRAVNLKWGGARFVPEDGYGRRYGTIGPVTADGVYFLRLHDLHCVDPLSGKTIWMRKNVPLGLDLFGDGEYLVASPVGEGESLVLKASTGELVGTRKLASAEDRMTTLGRNVLEWQTRDGKVRIEMRDVVADESLWSYEFAAGSKAALVSQEVVGVYEPAGQFSLVRLSDGKQLVKQDLAPAKTLLNIHLLPFDQGYLLATHTVPEGNTNRSVQPYPNTPDCPLITGFLHAFDRQGKPLWDAPVSVAQHGLLLTQPRDLPALVLLRQMNRPGPINSRDPKLSVMCVDKRTGRVVYSNDELPGTTIVSCSLSADPSSHEVTIALPNQVLTLTYTHDELEPQAAAAAPADREAATRAVLAAIGFPVAAGQPVALKDAIAK